MTKRLKTDIELVKEDVQVVSMEVDQEAQLAFERRKEVLKEDLIALYRQRYHTLPLFPLLEENYTPLLQFYIMPDIESVEIQRLRGGGKEVRSKVTSLHDVFYKERELCRKIYLTADAGIGKTAFSKWLVLTWCQASQCIQSEVRYFKEEAISAMSEFKFVFLLSLRDCSEECDIDEMIIKEIIRQLSQGITISDLETILSKEKCLVILDGLDSWTHPASACKQGKSDIPHRKSRRQCTILTTTRPWKFGVSKIRPSEIERKLEIVGLSETSAESLKRSVISLLLGKTDIEKYIQDFDLAVSYRGISNLKTIPLLLVYLLCLWCDGMELGASRTELYCQIVELLLKRMFEKYPDMQQSHDQYESGIPQCFSGHGHFKKHYILLKTLGQLAFETLFSENKESTLVFSQPMTEKHLTPEYMKLSLCSGLLTQSTEKTLVKQISKFSFPHKTVQEFLCALYITCQNESDIKYIFLEKCKSVQSILDMSTVLVFISGMVNAEIISSISQEFISVINKDKITGAYRSTADYDVYEEHPLKDIQDMSISCMKENPDKDLKIFCQDIFIDKDCKEEKYFSYLNRLTINNKNNMETIHIDTRHGNRLREVIDSCTLALSEPFDINKVYFYGEGEGALLSVFLNLSTKCVGVRSPFPSLGSWTHEMSETLLNNSLLQAIYIDCFEMSHNVLSDFLKYMINRKTMKEIKLSNIFCVDHRTSCGAEFKLDFSQHLDLRTLALHDIPVSQVKVNASLEDYHIGRVKSGLVTSYLRNLPAASQLQTFACGYQKSSGDVESVLQTLQSLVEVKHIALYDSNLGGRILSPKMVHIESVLLDKVKMPASALRDLVKDVKKLSHQVTIEIYSCVIEPETEFEDVKQDIRLSQSLRITQDDRGFVFETVVESR